MSSNSRTNRTGSGERAKAATEALGMVAFGDWDSSKKMCYAWAYIQWTLIPLLDLDYVRLAKTGKYFHYINPLFYFFAFISITGKGTVSSGEKIRKTFARIPLIGKITKIPVLGNLILALATAPLSLLYFPAPISQTHGYTKEEFVEAGVEKIEDKKQAAKGKGKAAVKRGGKKAGKRVAERETVQNVAKTTEKSVTESGPKFLVKKFPKILPKTITRYWDDLIEVLSIVTVVGPIIMTIIDIPFTTSTYKAMELFRLDEKFVKRSPKLGGFLVTTFLPKKYDENGNVLDDFTGPEKYESSNSESDNSYTQGNNKRVMTDGGRDQEDITKRSRLEKNGGQSDDGIEIPSNMLKILGIAVGGVIGILLLVTVFVGVAGGSGYAMLLDDELGGVTSGIQFSDFTEEIVYQLGNLRNTVVCFSDPGCIREYRLNQTTNPGSEDVGETYELTMDGPRVEGSKDIRFRKPTSEIPVDFQVRNTRHGTKGIDAKNVKYRVKVSETGILGDKTACKTRWEDLTKFGEGADVPNNNIILPGETATPLNYDDNALKLKECGLLNPVSSGGYRVEVQLKYDYSAVSFLNVDAMAHSEAEKIERVRSKTPDTPVETFIRADDPVTFDPDENIPRPFSVRVGFNSDEEGSFRIKPETFELVDSSLTSKAGECDELEKRVDDDDTYELGGEIPRRIRDRQDNDFWFSYRTGAPTASCNFELEDTTKISETGESLSFTAEADYTIRTEDKATNFQIRNTQCRTTNCPYIMPLSTNPAAGSLQYKIDNGIMNDVDLEEDSPVDDDIGSRGNWNEYWLKEHAICNRPQDAQAGCSWVRGFSIQDRRELFDMDDEEKRKIEEDHMAVEMAGQYESVNENFVTCWAKKAEGEQGVYGFKLGNLKNAVAPDNGKALNYTIDEEWEYTANYDPSSCQANWNKDLDPGQIKYEGRQGSITKSHRSCSRSGAASDAGISAGKIIGWTRADSCGE